MVPSELGDLGQLSAGQLGALDLGVAVVRHTQGAWRLVATNAAFRGGLARSFRDEQALHGRTLDGCLPAAAADHVGAVLDGARADGVARNQLTTIRWPRVGARAYRWTAVADPDDRTSVTVLAWDVSPAEEFRREAESQRAERSAVLDALHEAVLLVSPRGLVRYANAAATDLLGEALADRSWTDVAAETRLGPRATSAVAAALAGDTPAALDLGLAAEPGSEGERTLHARAQPVWGKDGEVTGAALVVTDLTDERRLAAERKELLNREINAREYAAADMAAGLHDGVLHTLTELTLVLSLAERKGEPISGDTVREYVDRSARQCRDVIVDLLPAGLEDGVDAALEAQVYEWTWRGLATVKRTGPQLPRFEAARERLVFAVALEALRNARHHGAGSPITMVTDVAEDHASVVVRDEGPGMAPEDRERAAAEGHLGLPLSRERMEAAGGSWSLASTPGEGTTVTIRWPLTR